MPADPQYDKVHPLAQYSSSHYGCYNRERPVTGSTLTSSHGQEWPYRFTTTCQYDMKHKDKRCDTCIHQSTSPST